MISERIRSIEGGGGDAVGWARRDGRLGSWTARLLADDEISADVPVVTGDGDVIGADEDGWTIETSNETVVSMSTVSVSTSVDVLELVAYWIVEDVCFPRFQLQQLAAKG